MLDAAGQIYVTNFRGPSVTIYSAGADGDAAPVRTIDGASSLRLPVGIALSSAGEIYVANYGGQSITVFAAGASGNATPVRVIGGANTGLRDPGWITF